MNWGSIGGGGGSSTSASTTSLPGEGVAGLNVLLTRTQLLVDEPLELGPGEIPDLAAKKDIQPDACPEARSDAEDPFSHARSVFGEHAKEDQPGGQGDQAESLGNGQAQISRGAFKEVAAGGVIAPEHLGEKPDDGIVDHVE